MLDRGSRSVPGQIRSMSRQGVELLPSSPGRAGTNTSCRNDTRADLRCRAPFSASSCSVCSLGTTNPHRYIISTQSDALRNHLRSNVPAVPVMHVKRGVTVMEPMSEVTKDKKESVSLHSPRSVPKHNVLVSTGLKLTV